MMRVFVGRARGVVNLQDRKLAQPRVKLALETDVAAELAEGTRRGRAVDQKLVEVDLARQQVVMLGGDVLEIEVGQAGHLSSQF